MGFIAPVVGLIGSLAGLAFMGGAPAPAAPPPQPAPTPPPPTPPPASKNAEAKEEARRISEAQRKAYGQEDTVATSPTGLVEEQPEREDTLLGG